MNNVFILHERFRKQCSERYPGKKAVKIIEELSDLCECGFENANSWYHRNHDIPARYVDTFAKYLDVDVLYLLGLQEDPKKEETDTAEYIHMSGKSVERIRNMTEQERSAMEALLSHPPAFSRLLDTIHECLALPGEISTNKEAIHRTMCGEYETVVQTFTETQENIDAENMIREKLNMSPSKHKAGDKRERHITKRLSEEETANILRQQMPNLKLKYERQVPLKYRASVDLANILEMLSPNQDQPVELFAEIENFLSNHPAPEAMTTDQLIDKLNQTEGIHAK